MKTNQVQFTYSNWRGETAVHLVEPISIEFGTTPHSSDHDWLLRAFDVHKQSERLFLMRNISGWGIHGATLARHFCVTVYTFTAEHTHTLLIKHRKLGKWLPPGGHVEPNETPEEAAVREVSEETGLSVRLVAERAPVDGGMARPEGLQLNVIEPHRHEHMDFVFKAIADRPDQIKCNESEAEQVLWIPIGAVIDGSMNTFPSIAYWVEKLGRSEQPTSSGDEPSEPR